MKKIITFFSLVLVAIATSAQTSATVDGIKYTLDGTTATVTYPNDSRPGSSNPSTYTGDIVIPPTINVDGTDYNVTTIGERAFYAANISSISLPEGLVTIGKKSLMNSKITELTVPSSVTKLGDEAVESCSNLTTITLNEGGGGTWGAWVFWRESGGYQVYMICDVKPSLYDDITFDQGHASTIHVKPSMYDTYMADSKWSCYNLVPDIGGSVTFIDFTVDGIKYQMTAADKVSVVYKNDNKPGSSNPNLYTGDIVIPSQVTHDGVTYNVTGIANYAFRYADITSIHCPRVSFPSEKKPSTRHRLLRLLCPTPLPLQGHTLWPIIPIWERLLWAAVQLPTNGANGYSGVPPTLTKSI